MNAGNAVIEVLHSLADFLFPQECPGCGERRPGELVVCESCRVSLEKQATSYKTPPRRLDSVDDVIVLLPYDETCRALVHALKYHGMPSAGLFFGGLLGDKFMNSYRADGDTVIVPVPLHPSRLRERGYNQSERIACGMSSVTGFTVVEDAIERARSTPTQTTLDEESRKRNVAGAFTSRESGTIEGRTVLLVDDVLTTGSTISECAGVLKDCGASAVIACVAATPDAGDD